MEAYELTKEGFIQQYVLRYLSNPACFIGKSEVTVEQIVDFAKKAYRVIEREVYGTKNRT